MLRVTFCAVVWGTSEISLLRYPCGSALPFVRTCGRGGIRSSNTFVNDNLSQAQRPQVDLRTRIYVDEFLCFSMKTWFKFQFSGKKSQSPQSSDLHVGECYAILVCTNIHRSAIRRFSFVSAGGTSENNTNACSMATVQWTSHKN